MLTISLIYLILSSSLISLKDITIFYNRSLLIILANTIIISTFNDNNIVNYNNVGLFNNLFYVNNINNIFTIFVLILSLIIIGLSSFFPTKSNIDSNRYFLKIGEQFTITEYPIIILFIIIGAIFLMSSNDIISIFLSIELQSYGLYLLSTLYRNSELSTSAGLTYFLLGGLSSCLILLGSSLIYANSGITNLDNYYIINNLFDVKYSIENVYNYTNYFLLIICIGLLFKISAAPFHFWSPDVYDAIPTITTTFVAIITKISIFILMFELINYTNNSMFNVNWSITLLLSSFLSLIIGTVLGLNQSRIKRLFAYSTISHIGFILLALSINTMESIQAFTFYLTQYSISNLNAFILLIGLGYNLYIYVNKSEENDKLLDRNNSPIQFISQLKGFFKLNPILSISLIITIYSLIGIPPLLGFFGKQTVLSSSLDQNYIFITIIAILTSVISAVYYLNIIKVVFFEEPDYELNYNFKRNYNLNKEFTVRKSFLQQEFNNSNFFITDTDIENLAKKKNSEDITLRAIFLKDMLIRDSWESHYTQKFSKTEIDNYLAVQPNNNYFSLNENITLTVSILTLIITLFIFNPNEWLNLSNIISIYIYT